MENIFCVTFWTVESLKWNKSQIYLLATAIGLDIHLKIKKIVTVFNSLYICDDFSGIYFSKSSVTSWWLEEKKLKDIETTHQQITTISQQNKTKQNNSIYITLNCLESLVSPILKAIKMFVATKKEKTN